MADAIQRVQETLVLFAVLMVVGWLWAMWKALK
jgi:hypothetical protein